MPDEVELILFLAIVVIFSTLIQKHQEINKVLYNPDLARLPLNLFNYQTRKDIETVRIGQAHYHYIKWCPQ